MTRLQGRSMFGGAPLCCGDRSTIAAGSLEGTGRAHGGRQTVRLPGFFGVLKRNKVTFPKVSCSPPWGWRDGGRWPRPECATGCLPGWHRWSPSSPWPLRDLWKGSEGVFLRAWAPRWVVRVPFCSSGPFVHLFYPPPLSLLAPLCWDPSRWRCTRFAAGWIKISRAEWQERQFAIRFMFEQKMYILLLVCSMPAVWSLIKMPIGVRYVRNCVANIWLAIDQISILYYQISIKLINPLDPCTLQEAGDWNTFLS